MKRLMALVLSIGLVLLGTAPVMAAGQAVKAAPPAQQEQAVQVAVPDGAAMGESELADVQGELAPLTYVALRGIIGAAAGAIVGAVKSYADTGKVNPKTVAAYAAAGLVTGVAGGASALIPKP